MALSATSPPGLFWILAATRLSKSTAAWMGYCAAVQRSPPVLALAVMRLLSCATAVLSGLAKASMQLSPTSTVRFATL